MDAPENKKGLTFSEVLWNDEDLEAGTKPRQALRRSNSRISIHSSRRGSIDISNALPIQYRTVSFGIDAEKIETVQKAKHAAAATQGIPIPVSSYLSIY